MLRARRLLGTFLSAGWLAFAAQTATDMVCPMHAVGESSAGGARNAHAHHAAPAATSPEFAGHAHGLAEAESDAPISPAPAPLCDCISVCGLGAAQLPAVRTVELARVSVAYQYIPQSGSTHVVALRTQFVLPFATAPPLA